MISRSIRILSSRHISGPSSANAYTNRTHTCGELREEHIGQHVSVSGWVGFRRMNQFLVVRDAYGSVQAFLPKSKTELRELVKDLPYESVVRLKGTVRSRGKDANKNMETGGVEIEVDTLELLNKAPKKLPLDLENANAEETRLKYRYLDLRRAEMQRMLRLRSNLLHRMRRFLVEQRQFVDVETPILFRRTPGGAAEFQVPASKPNQGRCYSLPQSPQQFKQLLMVGGLDRYFQIARCFRDEGAKIDRQPEFTQVDLELSFTDQEGVISLVEDLLIASWPEELAQFRPAKPIQRLRYADCMALYGVDKPDLRIPWKIEDCPELLETLKPENVGEDFAVSCFIIPDPISFTNRQKAEWKRLLEMNPESAPFRFFHGEKSMWLAQLEKKEKSKAGQLGIVSWGPKSRVQYTLGQLRNHVGQAMGLRGAGKMEFLWVVDFPLFVEEEGRLVSAHHPFTAPFDEDMPLLQQPGKTREIRGQHYDLVMNGVELGGGSIRIHDGHVQEYVLREVLNEDPTELAHLIEALKLGAPPHGGFALGLDRYVALLHGKGDTSVSVRETIAFPKSHTGRDVMADAPAVPTASQLERYAFAFTNTEEAEPATKEAVA
ncbi:unnamed protein product, partial [Mesorhabditis spiculigera]